MIPIRRETNQRFRNFRFTADGRRHHQAARLVGCPSPRVDAAHVLLSREKSKARLVPLRLGERWCGRFAAGEDR